MVRSKAPRPWWELGEILGVEFSPPTSKQRMDELAHIAYESAIRALDKQERVLEELRARTAVLLAGSSLAVSLLPPRKREPPSADRDRGSRRGDLARRPDRCLDLDRQQYAVTAMADKPGKPASPPPPPPPIPDIALPEIGPPKTF
jgi:hypothetical protein